jgi:hypothetical protein
MIWLGYIYLLILILFGGSALLDDIKEKKMDRFAISLVPFAVLVIATVGFLFLPKPRGLAWLVFAALAVSVPILVWDSVQDVKDLSRTDPEFGTGGAVFSALLVAVVFVPAMILGVLWAR